MTKSVASNGHAGNHQRSGKYKPQTLLSTEKPFVEASGMWPVPGLCAQEGCAFLGGRAAQSPCLPGGYFKAASSASSSQTTADKGCANPELGGTTAFQQKLHGLLL